MIDPFFLRDSVVHLDGGALGVWPNAESFWHVRDRPELATGNIVSLFSYTKTWTRQERHPTGDELVFVVEGAIDALIDTGDGERAVHLGRGDAYVVPAGAWHRAAVHEPSTLLFITPSPARTEERPAPN